MSGSCLVCFKSEECDLEGAVNSLVRYRFNVVRHGEVLCVDRGDGPHFKVTLETAEHVQEEANEFAKSSKFSSEMSKCNARFEIVIEDLDAALDEMNTLMEVQGALQDASKGYLFTPWNGNVSGPWVE